MIELAFYYYSGPIFTSFTALVGMSMLRINKLTYILQYPKGRCYGNQLIFFWGGVADVEIDRLLSLVWRSETGCNFTVCMHALIAPLMPLHRVKVW